MAPVPPVISPEIHSREIVQFYQLSFASVDGCESLECFIRVQQARVIPELPARKNCGFPRYAFPVSQRANAGPLTTTGGLGSQHGK